MNKAAIQIRDPFVVANPRDRHYYLYGTTDPEPWRSPGVGFDVYTSSDLDEWTGPKAAFRPEPGFWATRNFWAPEVHELHGSWYMFASFKADGACRATQILKSDRPDGPFRVHSRHPITPDDWECLDGTLHVDPDGEPWMVFCHEWQQVRDGQICAVRLSRDLSAPVGAPELLFSASQAAWTRPRRRRDGSVDPRDRVTDGPFMYRTSAGTLLMLWSSFSDNGYAMGISRSRSVAIHGPWLHLPEPMADDDSGHGMIFRAFDGRLYLTYHAPNNTPNERPVFVEIGETADGLERR